MSGSLETRAVSGAVILVGRQLFGILLSLIGMLVTTRLLGPGKYGQFVIVAGLAGYAVNLAKMGLDVYLIRHPGELESRQVGVTQALYLAIGLLLALLILAAGPAAAKWYRDPALCHLLWSYAVIAPLSIMAGIPVALLDRRLLYREAALTELAGQVGYVLVSVAVVWFSRSVWGMVLGTLAQTVASLVLASYWSRLKFRPCWASDEARAQLVYGFGYSASMWLWQARDLVNPMLVGKLLGAEAAAFVAMALRLSALVGFARSAVWRVYLSYLARLADDREKLKQSIESGLSHQVLVTGASFALFLAVAPDLVGLLMGPGWLPILQVLPFVAAGIIFNSGFSLYSSALYVVGKNRDVTLFHLLHLVLFAGSAAFFLERLGNIAGYGWAEVAAFLSYPAIRRAFRRRLFPVREKLLYLNLALFCGIVALLELLLAHPLWLRGAVCLLLLGAVLGAVPGNRSGCLHLLAEARERFRRRYAVGSL